MMIILASVGTVMAEMGDDIVSDLPTVIHAAVKVVFMVFAAKFILRTVIPRLFGSYD